MSARRAIAAATSTPNGRWSSWSRAAHWVQRILWICVALPTFWAGPVNAQVSPSASSPLPQARRQVLILWSSHFDLPWQKAVRRALVDQINTLTPQSRPEIFEEPLDITRLGSMSEVARREYLREKYRHIPLDLVMCEDVPACEFLERQENLFAEVPRRFVNYTTPRVENLGKTFVIQTSFDQSLSLFRQIFPGRRRVVVIGQGRPDIETPFELYTRIDAQPGLQIEFWNDFTFEELFDRVGKLPSDAAILYSLVMRDSKGQFRVPQDVLNELLAKSSVPVMVRYSTHLGSGALGGYVFSAEKVGQVMATFATRPQSPVHPPSFAQSYQFDARALNRWGVSLDRLPPGSELGFQQQSFWERYWPFIVGILLQSALLGLLIWSLVIKRRTQKELTAAYKGSQVALHQVQTLSDRLALALDTAQLGVFESDPQTLTGVANDRMFEIMGVAPDQRVNPVSLGRFIEQVHPEDRAHFEANRDTAPTLTLRFLSSDGQIRYAHVQRRFLVTANGLPRRVSVAIDVTDATIRTRALTALQSEQQLIIDSATVGLGRLRDYRYVWVNRAFAEMLGYTVEEMVGRRADSLLDDVADSDKVSAALAAGQQSFTMECLMRTKQGERRLLEYRAAVIDSGHRDGVFSARDVTEDRARVRAMSDALEAARAGERAKSEFLSVISHEIRTPLNGVLGLIQVASLQGGLPEQSRRALQMSYESGQLLLTVLNDVLDYSGLRDARLPIHPAPLRLLDLQGYMEGLRDSLPTREGVEFVVQSEIVADVTVLADELRLRQIMLNLVNNAVKFTHEGTVKVVIGAELGEDETVQLELGVLDTGIGMSEEAQSRLFTPFMQADMSTTRSYGGTGLGLAIVKGLVDRMQGEIAVFSRLGEGTDFTVHLRLPRVAQQPSQEAQARAAAQGGGEVMRQSAHANEAARLTALRRVAAAAAGLQSKVTKAI